ncbi:MAG TPA: NAD(P)H-dependent oxidoreductase subunit E [Candidatus Caenarcaniphilales bacterium]|nr:NAD(P)H-dependent oxidoreductase subunit E [Candidatus Caenarcaniphilales bacterium]
MSGPLSRLPGWGIAKGMLFSLYRFFQPKATVQYPEVVQEISPRHRGRLILLYDEAGNLKCETCFQCAMACPIEIIDMGGVDTKNRYHVHWGPSEQYAERREESALRRSGRPVPDRSFEPWPSVDLDAVEQILVEEDYDPRRMLRILERTQDAYNHLPVAAVQHISHATGAWYSEIYGIATSYAHLRFEPGRIAEIGICSCPTCLLLGAGRVRDALEEALATTVGGVSLDGAVRLVSIDCGGESREGPFVTLDGQRQPSMTADKARDLATRLRARTAQPGAA